MYHECSFDEEYIQFTFSHKCLAKQNSQRKNQTKILMHILYYFKPEKKEFEHLAFPQYKDIQKEGGLQHKLLQIN